jgi:hypothetical protein
MGYWGRLDVVDRLCVLQKQMPGGWSARQVFHKVSAVLLTQAVSQCNSLKLKGNTSG